MSPWGDVACSPLPGLALEPRNEASLPASTPQADTSLVRKGRAPFGVLQSSPADDPHGKGAL